MRKLGNKYLYIGLTAAISIVVYLTASKFVYRIGFPLDDAWIHQTYARNLASNLGWAFIPGQPSAGSTSPLWSSMLSFGYFTGLGPYIWTFLLGWIGLVIISVVAVKIFEILCPQQADKSVWVGIFLVLEWHLIWAALSGMETLWAGLIALSVIGYLLLKSPNWFVAGFLIGLGIWLRPDCVTLIGPALMVLVVRKEFWRNRIKAVGLLTLGILIMGAPYMIFNQVLAGDWWPNTFYAKQAEYVSLTQTPLLKRYISQISLPMVGAGSLLLPGFVLITLKSIRRKAWDVLAGELWLGGYLLIYALRLPVTYQHGRYIIPAMPVYFIFSLSGMASWIQLNSPNLWRRAIGRIWLISVGVVLLIFWGLGARSFAYDVAVIETEMVDTALWIAKNIEETSILAVHDIGAIGFYSDRELIDLAGLISPEVIPFIRDEEQLKGYLNLQGADYLITFPGWYPTLVEYSQVVICSNQDFSPLLGGENMCIYRWQGD